MEEAHQDRSFASHADFYADVYGAHLIEARVAGRACAALMTARHPAGDWSGAPTPDLVIVRLTSSMVKVDMDHGGGHWSGSMAKGSFIVVPPNYATTILVGGQHACEAVAIPYGRLAALCEGYDLPLDGDFGILHKHARSERQIQVILGSFAREVRSGTSDAGLFVDGLLLQLAAELLRSGRDRTVALSKGGLAPSQSRRVIEYMEDHLAADLSLTELAALTGLSPFHFCRAFRESTGLPPHRWRREKRMERARALLDEGSLSMADIAAAVGFDGPRSFARAFRKTVGLNPSLYRRTYQ